MSGLLVLAMSFTNRWNGRRGTTRSTDFCSFLISLKATVPGLHLRFFLASPA